MSKATDIIIEGETYFVANLDNGGVRVGILNLTAKEYKPSNPMYAKIMVGLEGADEAADADDFLTDLFMELDI